MKIRIGIISLGTVGSGVPELLDRYRDVFLRELGCFMIPKTSSRLISLSPGISTLVISPADP